MTQTNQHVTKESTESRSRPCFRGNNLEGRLNASRVFPVVRMANVSWGLLPLHQLLLFGSLFPPVSQWSICLLSDNWTVVQRRFLPVKWLLCLFICTTYTYFIHSGCWRQRLEYFVTLWISRFYQKSDEVIHSVTIYNFTCRRTYLHNYVIPYLRSFTKYEILYVLLRNTQCLCILM
jgi:hypothetical protein